MVLINGRKHACVSCIRGHRASSCSHTGRELQPVRRKGRPSSQCDSCKLKRARGNFHGKCQCNAPPTESGRSSSGESASPAEDTAHSTGDGSQSSSIEAPKGRHSLASLMNPCRCKTTGICTCCKSDSYIAKEEGGGGVSTSRLPEGACCDGGVCCSDGSATAACPKKEVAAKTSGSCCNGGESSTHGLLSTPTQRQGEVGKKSTHKHMPACQCGPTCSCPGCLHREAKDGAKLAEFDNCPELCMTCSACAYGLTRPSGIDAVDEWIERDKEAGQHSNLRSTGRQEISKKRKTESDRSVSVMTAPPPLPPFPKAASFFDTHFVDKERRRYFADNMKEPANSFESGNRTYEPVSEQEVRYGHRRPNESDEEWQIRHGFYHLTPEAVKIFDSTRSFKKKRQEDEENEERARAYAEQIQAAPLTSELDNLRQRALSARRQPRPPSTTTYST